MISNGVKRTQLRASITALLFTCSEALSGWGVRPASQRMMIQRHSWVNAEVKQPAKSTAFRGSWLHADDGPVTQTLEKTPVLSPPLVSGTVLVSGLLDMREIDDNQFVFDILHKMSLFPRIMAYGSDIASSKKSLMSRSARYDFTAGFDVLFIRLRFLCFCRVPLPSICPPHLISAQQ